MRRVLVTVGVVFVLLISSFSIAVAGQVMDRVQKKGELIVGITGTQPPLNATTKDGKIIGMDADLANLIATGLGVKVKFEVMPFPDLLPSLEKGKIDMVISSMTMTLTRNLKVAFVGPYYLSGKGILTKAKTIGALQKPEGLNKPEFKIAALKGSTSQKFVEGTAPEAARHARSWAGKFALEPATRLHQTGSAQPAAAGATGFPRQSVSSPGAPNPPRSSNRPGPAPHTRSKPAVVEANRSCPRNRRRLRPDRARSAPVKAYRNWRDSRVAPKHLAAVAASDPDAL